MFVEAYFDESTDYLKSGLFICGQLVYKSEFWGGRIFYFFLKPLMLFQTAFIWPKVQ